MSYTKVRPRSAASVRSPADFSNARVTFRKVRSAADQHAHQSFRATLRDDVPAEWWVKTDREEQPWWHDKPDLGSYYTVISTGRRNSTGSKGRTSEPQGWAPVTAAFHARRGTALERTFAPAAEQRRHDVVNQRRKDAGVVTNRGPQVRFIPEARSVFLPEQSLKKIWRISQ